ncbi:MAG: Dabb family protein [Limimaricola sp.]|uniref:Dabb family protein n=1 Tax=Limimaricola sp. TaxID=2211665 RepID=UPI001D6EFFA5|nr:Dabb family protein [Limimaricola sp.]MBI1418653.1 Dabb family protein [Limimaricola sp.]
MIEHVVMVRPAPGHDPAVLREVLEGLAALVGQIDGLLRLRFGPNRDFEGRSPGYATGFIASFTDAAALARYAADPRHRALGARLVACCEGGTAGLMVIDLDLPDA